ncbi:hypothetical protein [Herbaspirillum sp. VT-16-41]|uniref:hypothetical protein n=1 Tax=Herbaspirillum sp. VT-16-41 TaxID=1953765 RepID=UPI001C2BD2FE|nr:hypothetical protein [Herbaspirillum sp. VT-16-41]
MAEPAACEKDLRYVPSADVRCTPTDTFARSSERCAQRRARHESRFDDFSGGLKMTAREVMDIDEAREKYARGLAISLTDRQIDDQLLNRLRQSLEPHRSGTIPVHLYYQRADARARLRFGATWRVSPSDRLLNDLRGLIGSEQVELEFD